MSEVLDKLREISEGLNPEDVKKIEQTARVEAVRALVTGVSKLLEDKGKEEALEYAENTFLAFTATCTGQGDYSIWLPFVIDCHLVTTDRAVQSILRSASNTSMKGIIVELKEDIPATPLSDMYAHMESKIQRALKDDPEGLKNKLLKRLTGEDK